jgi:Glycosyl transferase family 2
MTTKLAVIVPVHNTPRQMVEAALESLLMQTRTPRDFEVIIVQDRNREPLDATIARFPMLRLTSLLLSAGEGVSAARNFAMAATDAPYVLLLDADDQLHAKCIDALLDFAGTQRGYSAYYANAIKYSPDMRRIVRWIDSATYAALYLDYYDSPSNPIYHSIFVGHPIMFDRAALLDIGGFNECRPCGELTDAVVRLHAAGRSLRHLDRYLYLYRENPTGLSKQPALHHQRCLSLMAGYQAVFGAPYLHALPLGRVAPFRHMHYTLGVGDPMGGTIALPYLDYETLTLRDHQYRSSGLTAHPRVRCASPSPLLPSELKFLEWHDLVGPEHHGVGGDGFGDRGIGGNVRSRPDGDVPDHHGTVPDHDVVLDKR